MVDYTTLRTNLAKCSHVTEINSLRRQFLLQMHLTRAIIWALFPASRSQASHSVGHFGIQQVSITYALYTEICRQFSSFNPFATGVVEQTEPAAYITICVWYRGRNMYSRHSWNSEENASKWLENHKEMCPC